MPAELNHDAVQIDLLRPQARALSAEAEQTLAGARANPTEAIHALRVALKRWRALLRLVEGAAGDEARRLRHEASMIARSLGQSRDVQAALDALADCAEGSDSGRLSKQSLAAIRARLEAQRSAQEASALDDAAIRRFQRSFQIAADIVAHWPLERLPIDAIADAVAKTFRRAQRDMPENFATATPETLHEFRKRVVVFRYQTDMLKPLWPKLWRVYSSEAQKLRALLGRINDLSTLMKFTAPHQPLARWRSRLTPLIADRIQALAVDAERLAQRIFSGDRRTFARMITAQAEALNESGLADKGATAEFEREGIVDAPGEA